MKNTTETDFLVELNNEQSDTIVLVPRPMKNGTLKTRDNRTLVAGEDARQKILQNFKKRGLMIPIGVGHRNSWNEAEPAVGWISNLQEINIVGEVEWTKEGKELIESKKFKYYSPELMKDYETHQIESIRTVGLVNAPNLYVKSLNHEQTPSKEQSMTNEELTKQVSDLQAENEKLQKELQAEKIKAFEEQKKAALTQFEACLSDGEEEFLVSSVNSEEQLSSMKTMLEKRQKSKTDAVIHADLQKSLQSELITGTPVQETQTTAEEKDIFQMLGV